MKDSQVLCQEFQIEFVKDLSHFRFVKEKVQILPYQMAKEQTALIVDEIEGRFVVALEDPLDLEALEIIQTTAGKKLQEICAPKEAITAAIEQCYLQKEDAASSLIATLTEIQSTAESDSEGYDLLGQVADSPVIRLLNLVLTEAIQQGASDVHFEPTEQGLAIRYRIDGVLQLRHICPKDLRGQLLARMKVLAKLDIAEQRLPQDGRIKLKVGGREIDFRVSTIPVVLGERIVLRILDKGNIILGLSRLGMAVSVLHSFEKLIHLSEGIILVTGPTGSGKTTTLYSAIHDINSPELNIMTIEDPVEYRLPNMAQVGVNPKIDLSFATGLRHILRQDPDIIMIGEIRDQETAEIAIQASLTGHLVLSTLHTNDAPSALTRLVEMGIEPYLLSSTVVGVMAQRLVRAICPHCKESYLPSSQESAEVGLATPAPFYRGVGCTHCFGLGYKGRHGIYELMTMSHPIKQKILKSADAAELRVIATSQGMVPLRHGAADLIVQGITTSSEVLRVTRGYEGE
jgi:general secretion pathway protein E